MQNIKHFIHPLHVRLSVSLLMLTLGFGMGYGFAHPDYPTVAKARIASSGLLPPVIESQRPQETPVVTPSSKRSVLSPRNKPATSQSAAKKSGGKAMPASNTQVLMLHSSAFKANQPIPSQFTCDGHNISPPLTISNVPAKAQSLVLIVEDPDAPGGTFTHWLLWNISPDTHAIAEGHTPASAMEGLNDFGKLGYGGPCPPSGTHRYRFKLYALDADLNLPQGASHKELERAMRPHVLSENILVGTYHRH